MRAVVWHGIGDIRLDNVAEPGIQDTHDAIVQVTWAAICGTDLHFIRGTVAPMKEGEILGHEGAGVVTAVGDRVRGLHPGDRVLVNSGVSCGACWYCRQGRTSQCDVANTNGAAAGTPSLGARPARDPSTDSRLSTSGCPRRRTRCTCGPTTSPMIRRSC